MKQVIKLILIITIYYYLNYIEIKKSKPYDIPLSTNSDKLYCFEMTLYNNEQLVLSLLDLDDRDKKYKKSYTYNEILKEFSVLPQSVKDDLMNLMYFQVFLVGLAKNKKIEINKSGEFLRVEFNDIAKAPHGAQYNVSVIFEKVQINKNIIYI